MKHSMLKAIGLTMVLAGTVFALSARTAWPAEVTKKTVIPTTLENVWQAIDAKAADLKNTIDKGNLAEVHLHAFAIRDLVAALPGKSSALSAEVLVKVKSSVKFVATLAARLDASGDANDAAGTKDNFEKLMTVLKSLRANYSTTK